MEVSTCITIFTFDGPQTVGKGFILFVFETVWLKMYRIVVCFFYNRDSLITSDVCLCLSLASVYCQTQSWWFFSHLWIFRSVFWETAPFQSLAIFTTLNTEYFSHYNLENCPFLQNVWFRPLKIRGLNHSATEAACMWIEISSATAVVKLLRAKYSQDNKR